MFDYTSRYYNLSNKTFTAADGNIIVYKERRFLPQVDRQTLLTQVTVATGDRLDLIANRILNDPLRFWQIADSNNAMNPFDLTLQPGRVLQIIVIESGIMG
jgi:hypothetical protein